MERWIKFFLKNIGMAFYDRSGMPKLHNMFLITVLTALAISILFIALTYHRKKRYREEKVPQCYLDLFRYYEEREEHYLHLFQQYLVLFARTVNIIKEHFEDTESLINMMLLYESAKEKEGKFDTKNFSYHKKFAILLIALGSEFAGNIFKYIAENEKEKLYLEIGKLEICNLEQKNDVLKEFEELLTVYLFIKQNGIDHNQRSLEFLEIFIGSQGTTDLINIVTKVTRSERKDD
jgi:hypothetical protein